MNLDMNAVQNVLVYVVAFNALLSGISAALGYIKDKTASTADDNAFLWVNKVMGYLKMVIDFVGYNPKH